MLEGTWNGGRRMDRSEAKAIAQLIGAAGTPGFGAALDTLVRRQAGFEMSVVLVYSPRHLPHLLHDGYTDRISKAALRAYLDGSYLLDPFYVASVNGHPHGLWRMRDLAPDSFFTSDFVAARDVHPCISTEAGTLAEEVGFLVPLEAELTATYSLMRIVDAEGFSEADVGALRTVEPIVAEAIRSDWTARRAAFEAPAGSMADMEARFASLFSDRLTATQREVMQLILRGHSALSIAMTMGISEGTAKNHRANIYRRLRISSQGELFRLFIEHLGSSMIRTSARVAKDELAQ